jgi:hypothetical protein
MLSILVTTWLLPKDLGNLKLLKRDLPSNYVDLVQANRLCNQLQDPWLMLLHQDHLRKVQAWTTRGYYLNRKPRLDSQEITPTWKRNKTGPFLRSRLTKSCMVSSTLTTIVVSRCKKASSLAPLAMTHWEEGNHLKQKEPKVESSRLLIQMELLREELVVWTHLSKLVEILKSCTVLTVGRIHLRAKFLPRT